MFTDLERLYLHKVMKLYFSKVYFSWKIRRERDRTELAGGGGRGDERCWVVVVWPRDGAINMWPKTEAIRAPYYRAARHSQGESFSGGQHSPKLTFTVNFLLPTSPCQALERLWRTRRHVYIEICLAVALPAPPTAPVNHAGSILHYNSDTHD